MLLEGWLSILATITGLTAGVGAGAGTYEAVIDNTSKPLAAIAVIFAFFLAAFLAATPFMVVISGLGLLRRIEANTRAALYTAELPELAVEHEMH